MVFVILKIGGAVITNKTKPYAIRFADLYRVAYEISKAYMECNKRIVLVHGGGSFGHATVIEHKNVNNVDSFTQITWFMRELNTAFVDALNAYGVPTVAFDTHAIFYRDSDGSLKCFYITIQKAVEAGMIPVLFGDVIFGARGPEILSGDEIVWYMSKVFKPCRILFATDVDGVYDRDPSLANAKLLEVVKISEVAIKNFGSQNQRNRLDVTGGMKAKLLYGSRYWHSDIQEVLIFNGLRKGFIYNAICGKSVKGTRVII